MTISTTQNSTVFIGNSATSVFSYSFLIPAAVDVEAIYTDASGVSTTLASTDYTITGLGNAAGGTITYLLAGLPIATGTTLTLARILPLTQQVGFSNQGSIYLSITETAFDTATMQIQQVSESVTRNLQMPITDPNAPVALPSAAARANKVLGFDSTGQPTAVSTVPAGNISAAMAPVCSAATLAAARTAMGVAIADGSIGTTQLANGAVTWAKLDQVVFNQGATTPATGDLFPFGDISDSGNRKVATASSILALRTAPTVQRFTSGSGTYTAPAGVIYIRVRMVGGGGGGAAVTTNNGANGGDTSFGSWTAIHGNGGTQPGGGGVNTTPGGAGGAGGVNGTGTLINRITGQQGGSPAGSGLGQTGGPGGSSVFGGGAQAPVNSTGGTAAKTNTGSGGAGGTNNGTQQGSGGGAGEYVEFFVTAPAPVSYAVGAAGAGGAAGVQVGGAGAAGVIIVEEYY